MLKRIKIRNYKSLKEVEVELRPLTVLFGPNAAGKSNFLDALQLLSRLATSRTLKRAFSSPYRGKPIESFSYGPDGLPSLRSKKELSFSMEVEIELSDSIVDSIFKEMEQLRKIGNGGSNKKIPKQFTERNFRYQLEIGMKPKDGGTLYLREEHLEIINYDSKKRDNSDGETIIHFSVDNPDFKKFELDRSLVSMKDFQENPYVMAICHELRKWKFFYFEPREKMREAHSLKEVRDIGSMGEELGMFLNTLKHDKSRAKDFQALEKTLHWLVPSIDGIDVEVNEFSEVDLSLREYGVSMSSRLLSEGTLRLLGLLALTKGDTPAVVGFEEPENGVHPRRIRLIADYLNTQKEVGSSQFIITTHSPNLIDRIEKEDLLTVVRKNKATEILAYSEWGPLFRDKLKAVELLDSDDEGDLSVSNRILRGDFDG